MNDADGQRGLPGQGTRKRQGISMRTIVLVMVAGMILAAGGAYLVVYPFFHRVATR